jgi:Ca2+-binding RTX toxin-like protein
MVGRPYVHTFSSSLGSPRGSFSVTAGGLPPGLVLSDAGVLSGTPTADGEYTFTISLSNSVFPDASVPFTMTVEPNAAPAATSDTYTDQESRLLTVPAPGVLGNETDGDGDPLTALLDAAPSHGEIALEPDGSFRYQPDGGFAGTDEFTYRASDGYLLSEAVTATITVESLNVAPVARGDAYTTREGSPLAVAAPGVLANDIDGDGDQLTTVLKGSPAHGAVTLNPSGSFRYTPAGGFSGTDRFTYQTMDGHVTSPPTAVTITVSARPTCQGDKATILGTRGADVLIGTPRADVIVASGGNDTIRGRGGDDLVCAGSGGDHVHGLAGDDRIYGGPGPDHLLGGAGDDRLAGQAGNDTLDGGPGLDRLLGGPGRNVVIGSPR